MAADEGAQQIFELLNQPSERLGENGDRIIKAAARAPSEPYGVMPQDGVDAVADIRSYFRDLRAQISAIETVDTAAKANALTSLDNIDHAIGAYERSLEYGISKPALAKLKKASKSATVAKRAMRGATRKLSQ